MNTARKTHPKLTPERIAELSRLAKKIDREERDSIKAKGHAVFSRHEMMQQVIAALKTAGQAQGLSHGHSLLSFWGGSSAFGLCSCQ
jgi:hypothetical protein